MMISFRKATGSDLTAVLDLIEAGFAIERNGFNETKGKEHRLLFSHLYAHSNWNPEWLYLAEQEGKILAVVGFFPQNLRFEKLTIPIWAISPVVTDPKYRGQGIASRCIQQAIEYLREIGITAIFLWGLPSFYPKLGFVPLLPRYKTKLISRSRYTIAGFSSRFRMCTVADLKGIATLYDCYSSKLWLQPCRNFEWWQQRFEEMNIESAEIKEVPFPKKENLLIWENNVGDVIGYLYYTIKSNLKVIINEAFAVDIQQALLMLQCFISIYLKPDQTLFIYGTPEHPLNIAAYRLGGIHLNPAPLAGMVKIIDWANFLNYLTPLFAERLLKIVLPEKEIHWSGAVDDLVINFSWQKHSGFKTEVINRIKPVDLTTSQSLTRLIFGLYDGFDFGKIRPDKIEFLQVLFPPKYPFIWDANYLY